MLLLFLQYAIVLALLVLCEIAGGIAAAVKKSDVSLQYYSIAPLLKL